MVKSLQSESPDDPQREDVSDEEEEEEGFELGDDEDEVNIDEDEDEVEIDVAGDGEDEELVIDESGSQVRTSPSAFIFQFHAL